MVHAVRLQPGVHELALHVLGELTERLATPEGDAFGFDQLAQLGDQLTQEATSVDVGDMPANFCGQILWLSAMLSDEDVEGIGFLDRRDGLALVVLDKLELEDGGLVELADKRGDGFFPCQPRSARAPLAHDYLEGGGSEWPDDDGLDNAVFCDARGEFFERILAEGTNRLADCVIPSFTNPNNMSIVTGTPPNVHGIAANFFHDRDSGEDVMTNTPKFLWVDTIFKAVFDAGGKVAVVTAKDKLTPLLRHGLDFSTGRAICFSSEKSDQATKADNGIERANRYVGLPVPEVYSADLSEFIFAAGVKLIEEERADLMYLSTTDYVQHKNAPGSGGANDFYAMMDGYFHKLDALGAVLVLTADHGMNAKHNDAGDPDAIYLQDFIDEWDLGGQNGDGTARVVLTITDPYVVHHGALGSFCTIYLSDGADADNIAGRLRDLDGILTVYGNAEGCKEFELPPERMGDLIVISEKHKVLGSSVEHHDLSGLDVPLRSHGGVTEQRVPLILNRPTPDLPAARRLRNFDAFDVALNYAR